MGDNKVAVITGGAHGIGKCIADEFKKAGVTVYVIDIAEGDHYVGDISEKKVLEEFADTVIREAGCIAAAGGPRRKSDGHSEYGAVSVLGKSRIHHRREHMHRRRYDQTDDLS